MVSSKMSRDNGSGTEGNFHGNLRNGAWGLDPAGTRERARARAWARDPAGTQDRARAHWTAAAATEEFPGWVQAPSHRIQESNIPFGHLPSLR